MRYEIRLAAAQDAAAICAVKAAVWPSPAVDLDYTARIIGGENRATFVSVCDGVIAGFVDGFCTTAVDHMRRWEVDLLAVHPDYRRMGIATSVVSASTRSGMEMGAKVARALVKVDNPGSQRAFAKAGYSLVETTCGLYVTGGQAGAHLPAVKSKPEGLHLIFVETLNYRGLWLEGELSADGFVFAEWMRRQQLLDAAGAVIPLSDHERLHAAESAGYRFAGNYQWWVRDLE